MCCWYRPSRIVCEVGTEAGTIRGDNGVLVAAVPTWHEYVPAGIVTAEAYACRDGIFRWAVEDFFFG